ncbi:hypothetical protein BS78_01G466300 [Paspalum vaginatum]|nr:hypothetical protein BS78_01G466300 [Paspalum vaginatum]
MIQRLSSVLLLVPTASAKSFVIGIALAAGRVVRKAFTDYKGFGSKLPTAPARLLYLTVLYIEICSFV